MRWLILLLIVPWFAVHAEPVDVLRITPDGTEIKDVRQITLTFNQKMVPLGEMERKAKDLGISITPALKCQWRWLDPSVLSCELSEADAAKPATRYTLTVKPGLKSMSGQQLAKTITHSFSTQTPGERYHQFGRWTGPGTPSVMITFNMPIKKEDAGKYIVFSFGGKTAGAEVKPPEGYEKRDPKLPYDNWEFVPQQPLPLNTEIVLKQLAGMPAGNLPLKSVAKDVVRFQTFPAFRFVGIECADQERQQRKFTAAENAECSPLAGVALLFSAPVQKEELVQKLKSDPKFSGAGGDSDVWENVWAEGSYYSPHRPDQNYRAYLPGFLLARREYKLQASGLQDIFGRTLPKPLDAKFKTLERPPNFVMPHQIAVLEKNETSEVPLYVTNLNSVTVSYDQLTTDGAKSGQTRRLTPDKVKDLAYGIPMGLREMLGQRSGVAYGSVATDPDVHKNGDRDQFFAQVTPYHVLAKFGHFNTTVWVTDMKTGKPVKGAKVEIFRSTFSGLMQNIQVEDGGKTSGDGLATLKGRSQLDPELVLGEYPDWHASRFMVRVSDGKEMAVLPLDYNFAVQTGDYENYPVIKKKFEHVKVWGTTAQGVYRAGDTIQYKIYVRDQDNERFVPPPAGGYNVVVTDPTGKEVLKLENLQLNDFGALHGEFKTQTSAAVGWYTFTVSGQKNPQPLEALRVLVSDFTPVPFKVEVRLNGDLYKPADTLAASTQATMHAGGPYAKAPVRVTGLFQREYFQSPHPELKEFRFDDWNVHGSEMIFQEESEVSEKGQFEYKFALEKLQGYGTITVEAAVSDDRGKRVADAATAKFSSLNRWVGLKNSEWVYKKGDKAKIFYAVADEKGNPAAGTPVAVKIEYEKVKQAKVKGAGNAYLTQSEREWVEAAKCDGTSGKDPQTCVFTPKDAGEYRITAEIKDTRGKPHSSTIYAWVVGSGRVLWGDSDEQALPLVPDKNEYKIGDTARFLIKNPLPGAKALITIERYGVIKSWIEEFKDSTAIVEFKLEHDFVPGFYLTVSVVSPRVEASGGNGQVDLGKPAIRVGMAKVVVNDPRKRIEVTAKTPKDVYKPRDKVKVRLQTEIKNRARREPIELAVAVVDEAVLSLIHGGANYYDPYKGFYELEPIDVISYDLLTRLVGRQKFEKKGAPAGGDGGLGNDVLERSLFKFVAYWNPSVKLDSDGSKDIEFTVPDNLTGWRVLAMAVTPSDRMGLGQLSFKVNKPTEIRPVMPNQVQEGDSFKAGFSVMNRTDKPRTLSVAMLPAGPLSGAKKVEQSLSLKPFERQTVWLPVKVTRLDEKRDVPSGEVTFRIQAKDKIDSDGLVHKIPVQKSRSLITAAAYGTTDQAKVSEDLQFPRNIYPDVGQVRVTAVPSVIGDLQGSFKYMKYYPYSCWEQKLTKGVLASHYLRLKNYVPGFEWPEASGLPVATLELASSYQAPNGGMTYYLAMDNYVSPYLSAYTGLAFHWLREAGYTIPSGVESKLHDYLKTLLKTKAVPSFYDEGMTSTVRAIALYVLAKAKKIDAAEVARFAPAMPKMSLFGRAHYLLAALATGKSDALQEKTMKTIMAQSNRTSGKFMFNETWQDAWDWLLATPIRDNCAVLSAVLKYEGTAQGKKLVGDIPFRLVRSLTQSRSGRDHWENTQENMFCFQAMADYAKIYENVTPNYKVTAFLDKEKFGEASFSKITDPLQTFARAIQAADVGRKAKVFIEKNGPGRLYYSTQMQYAPREENSKLINAGIDLRREYHVQRKGQWIMLKDKAEIKRGELVKVDLYMTVPAARNYVVVADPVPGGLEPVNRDLANESKVDDDEAKFQGSGGAFYFKYGDWNEFQIGGWSFYHREIRHDSVRFYSEYLMPGHYHLSYAAQAIASGEFAAGPTVAEEMYDPDVFGKAKASRFVVGE